jgi:glucose/arabinose dehydrogenase
VIAQYQVSANRDVANTAETVLLTIAQPYANHNGGMLAFGADGFLYVGMGDGGSSFDPENHAQNINDLLGKLLRLDVDHPNGSVPYSSPSTNPFFGATNGADEVYAYGFRNPWRFSFDRGSGQLWAGDVGQ